MKDVDLSYGLAGISFEYFEASYFFGSCLEAESVGDVDILLVYDDCRELEDVARETHRVVEKLCSAFEGQMVDLTVLSRCELASSGFLDRVIHERIVSA